MTNRHPSLTKLLTALEEVLHASAAPAALKAEAVRTFRALETPFPNPAARPARLPACAHLPAALEIARQSGNPAVAQAAEALAALDPLLTWRHRRGSLETGLAFHEGHANAMVIGPEGYEERRDVWLGLSLVAPGIDYPFHQHPPDELYLVLSGSEWYREDLGWFTPGIGGHVHNPPNARHAMRAGSEPLLAFWLLWSKSGPARL